MFVKNVFTYEGHKDNNDYYSVFSVYSILLSIGSVSEMQGLSLFGESCNKAPINIPSLWLH